MRNVGTRWSLAVLGALVGSVGMMRSAGAGIAGSAHDLSSHAPGGQICIACHTPHQAPNSPLLWNHTLSASNFTWSDWTQTTGGTPLPTNLKTWSGSTKLCLSCHDGTVQIGSILHPSTVFDATYMPNDHKVGAGGDLKGSHPVAVPYPYNGVKNTYNGKTTGDLALRSGWKATPTKVKLFYDPTAAAPNNRGIECASCHDPHGTSNSDFLVDTTTGSAICIDCHTK